MEHYLTVGIFGAGSVADIKLPDDKSKREEILTKYADGLDAIKEISWERPDPIDEEIEENGSIVNHWDIENKGDKNNHLQIAERIVTNFGQKPLG